MPPARRPAQTVNQVCVPGFFLALLLCCCAAGILDAAEPDVRGKASLRRRLRELMGRASGPGSPRPLAGRLQNERWFIRANDRDGDGSLSPAELSDALAATDRNRDGSVSEDEARRAWLTADPVLMRRADTNRDGLLGDPEWAAFVADFDRDADGQIAAREFAHLQGIRALAVSPWTVQRHDADHDGTLGREEEALAAKAADANADGWLDRAEAAAYILQCSGGWRRFDANSDGKLDASELATMRLEADSKPGTVMDPAWPIQGIARPGTGFLEKYDY